MARQFVLRDEVLVFAPIDRCFRLATCIEIVQRELRMRPAQGRTAGLVTGGDTVLWKGAKFGLPHFHESLIEEFRPWAFFRDRMIAGRFRTFEHDHSFDLLPDGSVCMRDEVRFSMRWGWFGDALGHLVLAPHIRRLMRRRFRLLKQIAESEEWQKFLRERLKPFRGTCSLALVIWITSLQKRSLLQRSRRSDKCLRGNLRGELERPRTGAGRAWRRSGAW